MNSESDLTRHHRWDMHKAQSFWRKKSSKFLMPSFQVSQIRCRFCVVYWDCVFSGFFCFWRMHQLVFRISAVRSKFGACRIDAFPVLSNFDARIFLLLSFRSLASSSFNRSNGNLRWVQMLLLSTLVCVERLYENIREQFQSEKTKVDEYDVGKLHFAGICRLHNFGPTG